MKQRSFFHAEAQRRRGESKKTSIRVDSHRHDSIRIDTNRCRAGSALVLVLVITAVMGFLVVAFAFEAHLELKYASFVKKKRQSEALAVSGIEIAKVSGH
jgi:hypothetical protein